MAEAGLAEVLAVHVMATVSLCIQRDPDNRSSPHQPLR